MSKQVDEIVIRISGDSKDLIPTLDYLQKVGKIDSENAKTFQDNVNKNKSAINSAKGDFEKFSDSIKDIGLALGIAFSVEKVIEFGKKMVESFREQEKSINSLKFAVTQVGNEGGAAFEKLNKQAEKLQKTSIFSDNQIRGAQTQLATLGLTSKQVEALTPKILDLASASGTDLATATDKVIQGINGQTRGLKDVGIAFEDTGSKTKNLSILTDELNKFQGATASALNTSAGAALALDNRFDSLLAKGGAFIDAQIKRVKELAVEYEDLFTKGANAATQGKAERAYIERLNKSNEEILKKAADGDIKAAGQAAVAAAERITALDEEIKERVRRLSLESDEKEKIGQRIALNERVIERTSQRQLLADLNKFYDAKDKIVQDATLKGQAEADAAELKRETDFLKRMKAGDDLRIQDELDKNKELLKKQQEFNDEQIKLAVQNSQQNAEIHRRDMQILDDETDAVFRKAKAGNKEAIQALKDYAATSTHLGIKAAEALKDIQDKINKEMQEQAKKTVDFIFDTMEKVSQQKQTNINSDLDRQEKVIDRQKAAAEKGLKNELDVEERKKAELIKARAQEQRKLKREKEVQAFLEAVISYNKEDPKSSVLKALAQVGLIEGALAVFAEEGALLGDGSNKFSRIGRAGMSRRHRSGKDILVQAEVGEGLLSRHEVSALGGPKGFYALKDSLKHPSEKRIPLEKTSPYMLNQGAVIDKLDELNTTIRNKPETNFSADDMGNLIVDTVEKGMREVTKIQLRAPRTKRI